jgi:hypothetical protein
MTTPKTLTIDDTEYVRADSLAPPHDSEVRIVVLQRGWVLVGRYREDGDRVLLSDAHVIERWGTTKGLGELVHGPTADTRLRHAVTPSQKYSKLLKRRAKRASCGAMRISSVTPINPPTQEHRRSSASANRPRPCRASSCPSSAPAAEAGVPGMRR